MPQRRGKKWKTNEFLSQLISHSAPSANICGHIPLWSYSHNATDCHSASQLLWGFTLLAHLLLGFLWLRLLWLFLLWPLPFPSPTLSLSTVAVRFLFRLVASPLAYQKVTYLTRHKWKSKRLISSSFSSTVCLCLPPLPLPPNPGANLQRLTNLYWEKQRNENLPCNLKICWQSAFSRGSVINFKS